MKKKFILIILLSLFIPTIVFAKEKQVDVKLDSCIDGDTANFVMNDKKIKVRFLAIDTPETKHPTKKAEPYGKEASEFTCTTLKNANNIVLEFDANSDEKDKYDRYLAWIFVDDSLLQDQLVSKGLAKVAYLYGDYKYTSKLRKSEKIAKDNKYNIWSNYKKTDTYNTYIIIAGIIIMTILYLLSSKFRSKTNRRIKKDVTKYIKRNLK